MEFLQQQLGLLCWPLLACSVLTLGLLLERGLVLGWIGRRREAWVRGVLRHDIPVSSLPELVAGRSSLLASGVQLLLAHQGEAKSLREEIMALWLDRQGRQLASGLKLLHFLGIISPLLGLLGTVLGMIQMFADLAVHQGPIEPALLADGLRLAMGTTAAGLLIAVPAMTGSHLYQLWVERLLGRAELVLNQVNLDLAGVRLVTEARP